MADDSSISPQQQALLMALMGTSQTPQGQMVPGGAGKQGTFAPTNGVTTATSGLSKALAALAMNNQMQTTAAQNSVSQAAQPGGAISQMGNQATNQMLQQTAPQALQFDDEGNMIGGMDGAMADME